MMDRGRQISVLRRAGQAAVVTTAAVFGSVGVAQAAALKEQARLAGWSTAAAAAAAEAASFSPLSQEGGAHDLGMLLAEAPAKEKESAEESERAKKLAEVRRIKAERQAGLNTKKGKKSAADKADGDKADKGKGDKASGGGAKGKDGLTPAERKKAERIKAAKEKAFAKALEREKEAIAMGESGKDEGKEGKGAEQSQQELEEMAAKMEAALDAKLERLAATKPPGFNDPKLRPRKKTGVAAVIEKVTGPRFVRNVNLRYLRDPFCAKGTNMFPTECAYTGFYELCETGRVKRVEYMPNMNSVKFFLRDTDEVFFTNLPYDPTLYKTMVYNGIDIVSKQYSPLEMFVRSSFDVLTPLVLIYFCWTLWQDIQGDDSTEGSTLQNTGTNKTYASQPRTGLTMKDIAGIDVVREEMDELISYLRVGDFFFGFFSSLFCDPIEPVVEIAA